VPTPLADCPEVITTRSSSRFDARVSRYGAPWSVRTRTNPYWQSPRRASKHGDSQDGPGAKSGLAIGGEGEKSQRRSESDDGQVVPEAQREDGGRTVEVGRAPALAPAKHREQTGCDERGAERGRLRVQGCRPEGLTKAQREGHRARRQRADGHPAGQQVHESNRRGTEDRR
jgi:hypothetical protein